MINALNHIQKIDNELITFSDDMDGLRKVPENIPNDRNFKKIWENHLLQYLILLKNLIVLENIIMRCLKEFLKKFNFKFIFKSSTENYKKRNF